MSTLSSQAAPTELVAGKYQLERLIGRGGMGTVWEGKHATLGTHVAVKFIEAEYAQSDEARQRFENEARAAAMLRSKHVVQVYDHGLMNDGRPYIVMEYLQGEPLDRRLDQAGRLAPAETVRIVGQVCRALAKAHDAGIVHRDLKPENVFLVYDEEDCEYIAKVVDFGIAKFTGANMGASSSTRTGSVLGTPYYMSPEQARGLRSVDYRSDLWSVGVITYRCLVGTLPFEGEAVGDLLVKICTAPLPVPSYMAPGIPPSFDAWFMRALGREPTERFQSAAELADSLAYSLGIQARSLGASPASSFDPGQPHRAHPAVTPGMAAPGFGATTPAPMYGSHPSPGAGPPSAVAGQPAAHTGAPFTQTRSAPAKAGKGGLIAVAVVGAIALAGGIALAVSLLSGPAAVAETVESAAGPIAGAPPPPVAEPKPEPPKPAVEPSTEPEPQAPAKQAEAPAQQPSAATTASKPVSRRTPKAPATKPAPKASETKQKPAGIDVGY